MPSGIESILAVAAELASTIGLAAQSRSDYSKFLLEIGTIRMLLERCLERVPFSMTDDELNEFKSAAILVSNIAIVESAANKSLLDAISNYKNQLARCQLQLPSNLNHSDAFDLLQTTRFVFSEIAR